MVARKKELLMSTHLFWPLPQWRWGGWTSSRSCWRWPGRTWARTNAALQNILEWCCLNFLLKQIYLFTLRPLADEVGLWTATIAIISRLLRIRRVDFIFVHNCNCFKHVRLCRHCSNMRRSAIHIHKCSRQRRATKGFPTGFFSIPTIFNLGACTYHVVNDKLLECDSDRGRG